ncbi:cell envelope integrity protein TolA [Vibrio cyclitrophicus]|nr:cell envelope integrity protein TolA [Vibrio cyclitrophicus]UPR49246.1 cell envelope integrity protein TolA [Vibrio cyclitrophicus]
MKYICLFLLVFSVFVRAENWTAQEKIDPFTDMVSFDVTTQAHSSTSGDLAEFRFFCDSDTVKIYGSKNGGFEDLQYRTMSVEMVFESAQFNPLHKVELTLRLDKKPPGTLKVKPINTQTLQFKNEYALFKAILQTQKLALKTESWNGEDYWIFDVAELDDYLLKFENTCPEQGVIDARNAEITSMNEYLEIQKVKELEMEEKRKEDLKKAKMKAEQARLKQERKAQKALPVETKAPTKERSLHITSETERYGAIYTQLIEKNLLLENSYKGKSCKISLRLIPTGSSAILGSLSVLSGDNRLCAATKRSVVQVRSYPLPSDPDVISKVKDINLIIEVE